MTEPDLGPTVQRVLLGWELRDAREAAGLTTTEATAALGWYSGKLSKVEGGDMKITDKDLAKAVRTYQVADERTDGLYRLAKDARRKVQPSRVPDWAAKYVHLERAAAVLKVCYLDSFPGLVQTLDYGRAMLSGSVTVSPADVDRMAEERDVRAQQLTELDAPRLWLVIGEEALRREIGGREVFLGQLRRVRELADLPNVTIQVLRFADGAHAAHGVSFVIIDLREHRPGIVYVETLTGSDYLGREHTRVYNLAHDTLRVRAASDQTTMRMLDERIAELS
ncbi:MAG TPA: helix-turn-helix transcriptional regulator [Pseudonocardiaceae bacterium]|nr:helix-turn-helix transcriptional regulator [Pseudonocardiaceae bacterium]